MRIKFNDINEGSDMGAGVEGRKPKNSSAKISGAEKPKKKSFDSHVKVIEGEGIPGKADRN